MAKQKRNNENYQTKTLSDSKYNYSREAEIIEGNAATGEQYSLKRVLYSEVPLTPEIIKRHLAKMDEELKQIKAENPYQVISAVSYEEVDGNQVIRFTPTTELIFPFRVPIFDEDGNQIVGEENIRAEIKRREQEWAEWERTGQLKESVEIHHTDDGKTVAIRFRAAPIKRHPNEYGTFYSALSSATDKLLGWNNKKPKTQNGNENLLESNNNTDINQTEIYEDNNSVSSKTIIGDENSQQANHEANSRNIRGDWQKLAKKNNYQDSVNPNRNNNKNFDDNVLIAIGIFVTLSAVCATLIKRKFISKNRRK